MVNTIEENKVDKIGAILTDGKRPLKERFRSLFTLRNLGDAPSLDWMGQCLLREDCGELLKHEVAYCLGQTKDPRALPVLRQVLENTKEAPIVRHEAGEAMAAIGDQPGTYELLEKYSHDAVPEVRDTCLLALQQLKWIREKDSSPLSDNPYDSVDPAPPLPLEKSGDIEALKKTLLDENLSLFDRYRAMFTLRNNRNDEPSIRALAAGLKAKNSLFRHEIAYVLGQIQSPLSKDALLESLRDKDEHPMVRHEAAEALGSLACPDIQEELKKYLDPKETPDVVRESCEVALDYAEYNQNEDEFQYADTLNKV